MSLAGIENAQNVFQTADCSHGITTFAADKTVLPKNALTKRRRPVELSRLSQRGLRGHKETRRCLYMVSDYNIDSGNAVPWVKIINSIRYGISRN